MDKLIKECISTIDLNSEINLNKIKNDFSKKSFPQKISFVRLNINKKEIEQKINTFITNTGMDISIKEIKDKILNDELFAAWFIKDSSKQNIYEKLQLNILQELGFKTEKLPASGKNRLFINNGNLTNQKSKVGKSIDFKIELNGKIIYIACKFTKDTGGAQDNQAIDLKHFIIEANKYINNNSDNIEFWALGDGEYYQQPTFQNDIKLLINNKVKFHTINTIKNELK